MSAFRSPDPEPCPLTRGGTRSRRSRPLLRVALGLALGAIAAVVAGFPLFLHATRVGGPITTGAVADAVVVLTGDNERIESALDLFASGHGQRLLISGAEPRARLDTVIAAARPAALALAPQVDMESRALDTEGNARETRRWAEAHGFRTLLLVTSGYHMPRALLEMRRQMPNHTFLPVPIITERWRQNPWSDMVLLRITVREYLKFLLAWVRARLTAPPPITDTAGAARPARG